MNEQSDEKAPLTFRGEVRGEDVFHVRRIVESTGFFAPFEVDVAVELILERINQGEASGYYFVFVECGTRVVGYTCYGLIPCTISSYDIYWIAVSSEERGRGIGKKLLRRTEEAIKRLNGTNAYLETAGKPAYLPTRAFYKSCGYIEEALLKDFYAPGDDKVVYSKKV